MNCQLHIIITIILCRPLLDLLGEENRSRPEYGQMKRANGRQA